MNALKRVWGRQTSQEVGKKQKEDEYIQATFHNYENPQKSFSIDSRHPQSIFYTGGQEKKKIDCGKPQNFCYSTKTNENKNPLYRRHSQNIFYTEKDSKKNPFFGRNTQNVYYAEKTFKKDTPQKQNENKIKSISELSFFAEDSNIVLSEPKMFTWQNKEAYIYRVESTPNQKRDFEFVIYIPIDTAVKWLTSPPGQKHKKTVKDKSPEYITEQATSNPKTERATNEAAERNIKYGVEKDNEKKSYAIEEWKRESTIDSTPDEDDDDDDDDKQPDQAEEKKVKKTKMVKKKPKRIITTYEVEEDTVSLGGLRPTKKKEPTKIVESNKVF